MDNQSKQFFIYGINARLYGKPCFGLEPIKMNWTQYTRPDILIHLDLGESPHPYLVFFRLDIHDKLGYFLLRELWCSPCKQ